MLVSLSELIVAESTQNHLFCCISDTNYKVYTYSSKTVAYALTKQESKRIQGLTFQLLIHLAMLKFPEVTDADNHNLTDAVNKFLLPAYNVCKKEYVSINKAFYQDDDKTTNKVVVRELKKHNHSGVIDLTKLLLSFNDIIHQLEEFRLKSKNLNSDQVKQLVMESLTRY